MTTDLMEIHNLLYEHRKDVCRLMATEKMNQTKRNRLYKYACELQDRINALSKNIYFDFNPPESDQTIKDFIGK
jgi:hypothetical protein